jgi:hypothetical protein
MKTILNTIAVALLAFGLNVSANAQVVLLAGFDGNNTYLADTDGNSGTPLVAGGVFQSAGDKYIRDPHQSAAAATAGFTAELYMANNIAKEMQWAGAGQTSSGAWGSGAQGPFTPAPSTANVTNIYTLDSNSGTGTLEFRVTNGGTSDISLSHLFFAARPASSGSTQMVVSYASGDLAPLGGGSTNVTYTTTNSLGYDVDLTSILSDNILGGGESATFTLVTASGLTNRFFVDDIGMSGSVIPEPSSFALIMLGLGGLFLLRRCPE